MDRPKILGQAAPVANQLTLVYQCPETAIGAVSSSVVICNSLAVTGKFSLYVVPAGQVVSASNLVLADADLIALDTYIATIGFTWGPLDSLYIQTELSGVVCTVLGAERA